MRGGGGGEQPCSNAYKLRYDRKNTYPPPPPGFANDHYNWLCVKVCTVQFLFRVQYEIQKFLQNKDNNHNTLLKSNVTTWSVGVRCRGSQECGSRFVNFACQFHARWHAVSGSSHNSEIYNIDARAR